MRLSATTIMKNEQKCHQPCTTILAEVATVTDNIKIIIECMYQP